MTARQLRPRGGVLDGVMVVEDEVEYFWAPVPDSQFVVGYSPVWKSTSASGAPTPSSRRRVDGVEVDATVQHERAVKF